MMKHKTISFLSVLLIALLALAFASAESAYITPEAARLAALTHAGVAETDATIIRIKLDRDDGVVKYDVEFYAGGTEYDYDIDAATGAVLGFDSEPETAQLPIASAGTLVTEEAAKLAAFAHAKVDPAAATLVLTQLDCDDGRWVYEIEFYAGSTEYDYEIDAVTGEVASVDQDVEHDFVPDQAAAVGDIGAEKAKEIALAHAKLAAADVSALTAELDRDDGMAKYEVEFKAGGKEYSYDIDPATGSILKHNVEADD